MYHFFLNFQIYLNFCLSHFMCSSQESINTDWREVSTIVELLFPWHSLHCPESQCFFLTITDFFKRLWTLIISGRCSLLCTFSHNLTCRGLPCGSDRKESACNLGDLGLNPGSGRSGGGHGSPLQHSCLDSLPLTSSDLWTEEPYRSHKELDETEQLTHTHTHTHTPAGVMLQRKQT